MNRDDILKILNNTQAILKGHFILSSGLHSDTYIQCAKIFLNYDAATKLCSELANKIKQQEISFDIIVSPALGGILVGYEVGRHLNCTSIFCERRDGVFTFKRFNLDTESNLLRNKKVLIIEDVITTGRSSLETIRCIEQEQGNIVAEACIIDRRASINTQDLQIPIISLIKLDISTYEADNIPHDLNTLLAIKLGSRKKT